MFRRAKKLSLEPEKLSAVDARRDPDRFVPMKTLAAVMTVTNRARDRNDSARVPGSSDRLQRGVAAPNPLFVYRLLSPISPAARSTTPNISLAMASASTSPANQMQRPSPLSNQP